jgi:acyl dehydratase
MKFAELYPGQMIETGDYTVTEEEIVEFARKYDPQAFHIDKNAAEETRWGGLISSGFHTCSMGMRLVVDHILKDSESMGSPGLDYVKWINPVRPGDRLRVKVRVVDVRPSKSGRVGVVRWEWHMFNQENQAVMELAAVSLFTLAAG